MLRKIEDFQKDWAYEAEMTGKMINALTDESIDQKVTPTGRSLGFLAWHLTQTLGEMLGHVGLKIDAPGFDKDCPKTAAEISQAYEKAAGSVSAEIAGNWNDDTLLQEDNMYGETWSRGLTLFYLITHQAHHRGQMTVLMRQAGLIVPGVYGPAKEEWQAHGMPVPA
ncbi:MAG: DinB family protein [Acidobacteria bacterium]|nr:DinB family protein [Acidobacteriota bacterium]MCA1608568.1 DinB family protein [Acidobacteriota bacterium]